MTLPLEGIRVIDWTILQQGPIAAMMLADMGAEVIKIEDRVTGDPARGIMKGLGQTMGLPYGRNFYFEGNNRNKKGITLDLKKPAAREVVYRLVKEADVFIQNFRGGVAERLGMDYETLSQYNPRLIYGIASGYGPLGPDAGKPSVDPTGQARAGFMDVVSAQDMPPQWVPGAIADQMAGIMLAYGIVIALLARDRLGIGQKVEASQLSSMMWLQGFNVSASTILGRQQPKFCREEAGNPICNYYKCADRRWLFLALFQSDRYWHDFCRALDIENLEKDPRFEMAQQREKNCRELISILDEIFAIKNRADWLKIFEKYPDFICDKINTISDLATDPQVLANDYITDFNHPTLGPLKMIGIPVRLDKTPGSIRTPAPEFSQHTEEVLLNICGYDWDTITRLKAEEVI